jgi:hypothetical protein
MLLGQLSNLVLVKVTHVLELVCEVFFISKQLLQAHSGRGVGRDVTR